MPDEIATALPADSSASPASRQEPQSRSLIGAFFNWLVRTILVASILMNIFLLLFFWSTINGGKVGERHYSGDESAPVKVAIVRVDGPILEGFLGYANQQLEEAARDDEVRAVVLAINSPGGSVTASDQLWKKVKDLRDGQCEKQSGPKPIVAAMGSIAASGGYYIAAPAEKIYAEPTTITGSIGVYAPFLDLHKFAQDHGIAMNLIKKGELKASGSMFHEMSADERIEWDEMLETVYQRFMAVVREGRNEQKQFGKRLKYDLRDEIKLTTKDGKPYVRRLADGGVYTAGQAKDFGLVDGVGYMDDAIAEAKRLAGLTTAHVIAYQRPASLLDAVLGIKSQPPDTASLNLLDVPGATSRVWLLTPGFELSGVKVSGAGR